MPFGKDQDLLADCLHLTEDMAGQDDRMCPAQLPDELADLDDLCRVQADRRLVQNDEPGTAQQCLCNANPLLVALGKAADEPGHHLIQPGAPGGLLHLLAALGFFDGVHLGHRAVIAEAVKQARAQNGKGAVFTFEPPHHTDRAVSKSDVKLLQSPESRDRVMEELGVELVLCPPFESFYNFSPEEFVREILKNCLNCRGVVCGEDYRFGKKGAGNVALLRELAEPMGIAVTALEPVTWKGETVSSSRIRRCLLEGDTELAGELLGTPYAVCGKAVRRGEELCLRLPPEMALPAEGCYHGLDKTHGGRPVLLTVREGAIAWRGEAAEQEPVELAFLGRG